ncbi:MAG: hypothetical protein ACM3TN_11770 [Alphaproteobacteria bacterium]
MDRQNWIVAIRPQSDLSTVDLFFDFWQARSSYTAALTFADGSTQTVQAAASTTSVPVTVLSNPNSPTTSQSTFGVNALAKIGVFRPATGQWFLDMNGNGGWDGCSVDKCLGSCGIAGDLPITGD